jgi:hypothetical protein
MVGIGGINKMKIDRTHCMCCEKVFEENESKVMSKKYDGFLCLDCDEKKNGGDRV